MRYTLWLWFYRLTVGTWSPLHRLRMLWLDVQIAWQLLIRFSRIL